MRLSVGLGLVLMILGLSGGDARAASDAASDGVTDTTITFGQPTPLRGSVSALGRGMRAGLLAAFAETNAAGGVHGRQIDLISRNDDYTPEKSIAITRQLIEEDRVFAIIGAVGTQTSSILIPMLGREGVPYIGAFTGASLLRRHDLKHVVNLRPSYDQETSTWVEHLIRDLKINQIAIFYQSDGFGEAGRDGIRAALRRHGLTPSAESSYERNTAVVKAAVANIQASAPQAVAMICVYEPCAEFIKQARKQGMRPLFFNLSIVGANTLAKELGEEGEGVVMTQILPPFSDTQLPLAIRYRAALKSALPDESPGYVSMEGYVLGRLVIEALRRIEGRPTRAALLEQLLQGSYDLDGFKLTFGAGRTQGSDAVYFTRLQKDGSFVPLAHLAQ